MRPSILLVVSLAVALPAAAAPPRRQAVLVLPPSAPDPDTDELALVMQGRAGALLAATGRYDDLHAKQILRVTERERLSGDVLATPEGAALVARRLGARRAVYGKLEKRAGGGWTLTAASVAAARDGARGKPITVELPAALPEAIDQGAVALAGVAAAVDKVKVAPPKQPLSKSAEAVAAYVDCQATLVRQPIVLDAPVVLDEKQLEQALASCQKAVAADAGFEEAQASLGLALALGGKDEAAVQALATVKDKEGYNPMYWLARYWLVTRYQSVDAGATALRTAIQRHPYFLLAYGYLAEHEHAQGHHAQALAAWQRYEAILPDNNYIHGRISRCLAQLGKHKEAIAEAKATLARDPTDREISLELASRHIDAGDQAAAIRILRPLADDPGARAELFLRLGHAYAANGDAREAETWLRRAEGAAQRPGEWRTRARARIDLGMLLVKSGRTEEGNQILLTSKEGGLGPFMDAQRDEQLTQAVRKAETARKGKPPIEKVLFAPPTEVSPFIYDGAGAIISDRDPPPAPRMFEVIRF